MSEAELNEVELTEPQTLMFESRAKFLLFVAGYGSGKTQSLIVNSLYDALTYEKVKIGSYCPTYDLLKLNLIPRTEEILTESKIPFTLNKSDFIFEFENGSEIIMRSMDNPGRIVAYETFAAHVDEIDTMKKEKAADAWRKIMARNRQKIWPPEIEHGNRNKSNMLINRVRAYTTPDYGFNSFTYSMWGELLKPGYEFIRAPSYSNPHLPDDYVQNIRDTYPAELAEAYIEGIWCNFNSGIVYRQYNRIRHRSKETIKPKETLYIGMDFNVTKMAAAIFVLRPNGLHCVKELVKIFDTPAMIEAIKERWPNHNVVVYPDASGGSRKSVDASKSDISLLRTARFDVRARPTNPAVKDRINAVNKQFEINKVYVNDKECPTIAKCLEQQPYDVNGDPEKNGDLDHPNDAFGYPIAYEFPIVRPLVSGRTKGV